MGKYLIAGLGNPGKTYVGTRHNIGFEALTAFAAKHKLAFRQRLKWKASVAEGKVGGDDVILMMPLTFMNDSGDAVAPVLHYLGVELAHLLVVVDDVAIPMEQLRIRTDSGSGGHNGLKSIEDRLQTNRFARLRIGVGDRKEGGLSQPCAGPVFPRRRAARSQNPGTGGDSHRNLAGKRIELCDGLCESFIKPRQ